MTENIASKPISEITEAEWQEMDDRLAREVQGWFKLAGFPCCCWHDANREQMILEDDWHPHRDPAQMDLCLRKMVESHGWSLAVEHNHYVLGDIPLHSFDLRKTLGWQVVHGREAGYNETQVGVLTMNRALNAEKETTNAHD